MAQWSKSDYASARMWEATERLRGCSLGASWSSRTRPSPSSFLRQRSLARRDGEREEDNRFPPQQQSRETMKVGITCPAHSVVFLILTTTAVVLRRASFCWPAKGHETLPTRATTTVQTRENSSSMGEGWWVQRGASVQRYAQPNEYLMGVITFYPLDLPRPTPYSAPSPSVNPIPSMICFLPILSSPSLCSLQRLSSSFLQAAEHDVRWAAAYSRLYTQSRSIYRIISDLRIYRTV